MQDQGAAGTVSNFILAPLFLNVIFSIYPDGLGLGFLTISLRVGTAGDIS